MDLANVRIREHFGLLSTDTTTSQFRFLVSPPKNRATLEKNDYVIVDHPIFGEACPILAVISEINSCDEVASSTINEKRGSMQATADIVGYVDLKNENKPMQKVLVPPNPGGRVYVPLKSFLEDILNRDRKGEKFRVPMEIGFFEGAAVEQRDKGNLKCFVDGQEFSSKHTIISSIAHAGKTHIAKKIINAIIEKQTTQVVIFDSYGEYTETGIKIALDKIKIDEENLQKELARTKAINLNGRGLALAEKQFSYTNALKALLKLKLEGKAGSMLVIIEDAENLQGPVLYETVAAGRKIGLSVCLLTTHPSELGGKILSLMGNQIIGKTCDPADIECLTNMAETSEGLVAFRPGEWIMNGINVYRPIKMLIE